MSRRNKVAVPNEKPASVVASDSFSNVSKRQLHIRQVIVGAVALITLLLAGIGYYYAHYWHVSTPAATASPKYNTLLDAAQAELKAARTNQEKTTAYDNIGTAYVNTHQLPQAIAAYKQALHYSPYDVGALTQLSLIYEQLGQKDNAVQTLQEIVTVLQKSPDSRNKQFLDFYRAQIKSLEQ